MAFTNVGSLHIPWGNVTDKPGTFPPSSHTHSYLPLSGGTLTGGLNPQGGIAYWGNDDYIGYPYGGVLMSQSSSTTGYLKITLPVSWNSCMMKFKVSIYNYVANSSCDYFIGGYNYSGGSNGSFWTQTFAYSIGDDAGSLCNLPVRFYHDGSKCCVGIGETTTKWAYPQVVISDLTIGYSGGTYANFRSGWNLSITSTAFANVSGTVTNPYVGSSKYAPISHTHSQYAPTSHTHTFAQISDRNTHIYDATLSRTANTVLAAPNGSNGAGTFRKLVSADIPSLDAGKIASGTLPVARGGTGVTSNPSMLVNLGSTSAVSVFATSPRPGITGTLSIANGGTGSTTASAARSALGITPANIGAAASSHTHAYAGSPSAGGSANTLYSPRISTTANYKPGANRSEMREFDSGAPNIPTTSYYHILTTEGPDTAYVTQLAMGMTTTNIAYRNLNADTWSAWQTILTSGNYKTYCTPANIGAATSGHTHSNYLTTSGTAAAATKLATARTIALSGDVTGSTSFNGTANVTISATVANDSHSHSDSTITSVGAGKITGTLAIAHGGTGGTTAAAARGNLGAMGAVSANGYYGMTRPDGDTGDWIRTTTNGIIPYQSGGSSSLGSDTWFFNKAHIRNITLRNALDATATSSAASYSASLDFKDKNGIAMGDIQCSKQASNNNAIQVEATRTIGSTTYYNSIRWMINNTGGLSYSISSPAAFRNILGLGNTSGALPVANGGTGATARGGAHTSSGLLYKIGLQAGTGSAPSSGNAGMVYIQYS